MEWFGSSVEQGRAPIGTAGAQFFCRSLDYMGTAVQFQVNPADETLNTCRSTARCHHYDVGKDPESTHPTRYLDGTKNAATACCSARVYRFQREKEPPDVDVSSADDAVFIIERDLHFSARRKSFKRCRLRDNRAHIPSIDDTA